jgi:hypothetical protein
LITVGVDDLTLCPHHDRLPSTNNLRRNMKITVGDTYTTKRSKITGTVKEIHEGRGAFPVLLLDVDGVDRWTTVTPY